MYDQNDTPKITRLDCTFFSHQIPTLFLLMLLTHLMLAPKWTYKMCSNRTYTIEHFDIVHVYRKLNVHNAHNALAIQILSS